MVSAVLFAIWMAEPAFDHACVLYGAMTPDSQERVLDRFDDMLATYFDSDVCLIFIRAVAAEFNAIERRMLLAKPAKGRA